MGNSYNGVPINTSKNTHEVVFSLISKGPDAKIADLPSGRGAFVLRLKEHGFKDVFAIDIENELAFEHPGFVQADMTERLPFDDASLDVLVCIDGIEHIGRQFDFVKEAGRVLKPGGELIISTPNISSLRSRFRWLFTGHHYKCISPLDERSPSPLHHIAMISFPELRYLLHSSGFEVTDVTANRVKAASLPYAVLVPFAYLCTSLVYFRQGKELGTSAINREVKSTMFSIPVLFGEILIVKAVKPA